MSNPVFASSSIDVSVQRVFSRRQLIPLHSATLWRIERGVVCTSTFTKEGKFVILSYWGPGNVVGRALSPVEPYQIECLTSVEASILPETLWYQNSKAILLQVQQLEELLNIMHQDPLQQRLWQFLLWLAHNFGCDVEQGRMIDLVLTHEQMAATINSRRVTVSTLLSQFEREGRLQRHQRRLVLCQL